jgi:nicotinate-nucleotide pyrophosphorylase (carboxylating)
MTLSPEVAKAVLEADLDLTDVLRVARLALEEDLVGGDITTEATVPPGQHSVGVLTARESGIVAGIPVAMAVFDLQMGGRGTLTTRSIDGSDVRAGDVVLTVSGPTAQILTAERTALNLLCHMSGVATLTHRWVRAVAGTRAVIRDTRKTMPGIRALEKYAVRAGGGANHRMTLTDQALIKDNHVIAAGGVAAALAAVRRQSPDVICEIECDTVAQVREAVDAGAVLVLLDNMSLDEMRESVRVATAAGARTKASGGLTLDRAADVAATGVDYLAVGALTHSAPVLDFGLDLRTGEA